MQPPPNYRRLKVLEDVLELYLSRKHRADEYRDQAHVLTDIMASDLSDELQECCWKLLRHLKNKERELRLAQERIADEKAALLPNGEPGGDSANKREGPFESGRPNQDEPAP